jgi:hypothetical protein
MSRWSGVSRRRQKSKPRGCVDNRWNRELRAGFNEIARHRIEAVHREWRAGFNEIVRRRIETVHRMMKAGNIGIISVHRRRNRDRIRHIHFSLHNSPTSAPIDPTTSLRTRDTCSDITISPRASARVSRSRPIYQFMILRCC